MDNEFESNEAPEETEESEAADVSGEESDTEPAENEEADGEETNGQESAEAEPEGKKSRAEERFQKLANERRELREKLEALEARFAAQEQEKPDFVEVDYDRLNAYIQTASDKIEELKLAGNFLEARKLERSLDGIIADVEANEAKRKAYSERTKTAKEQQESQAARLKRVEDAAELYRQHENIPADKWQQMGEWFAAELGKDPLLAREYQDRNEVSPVAAIKWAHEYVKQNMAAPAKAAKAAKEQAKGNLAPSMTASGEKVTTKDLDRLLKAAQENGSNEAWGDYFAAKRKAGR